MTTTLTLGPNAWPLSIKASMTAEGVTLLVQSDDWREAVTISQTRAETLAVLREAIAAVEALQCGYGWGCTDLECPEHGPALRANAPQPSPAKGYRITQHIPMMINGKSYAAGETWIADQVEGHLVRVLDEWLHVVDFDWDWDDYCPEDADSDSQAPPASVTVVSDRWAGPEDGA